MSLLSTPASTRLRRAPPADAAPGLSARRAFARARWHVSSGSETLAPVITALDYWEEACRQGRVSVVKTGPHRTVYHLRSAQGEFYLKHYHARGALVWLKHLVRRTRAEHECAMALRLSSAGLKTIRPVAVGVVRHAGSPCESLLITRAIADAVPLDEFCVRQLTGRHRHEAAVLRARLARAAGIFLARLHRAGGDHRDLHAGNLLVELDDAGEVLLSLIDLQALRFRRHLSPTDKRRALAAFNQFFAGKATQTDRLRFWRAYGAAEPAVAKPAARSFWDLLAWSLGWQIPALDAANRSGPSARDAVLRRGEEAELARGALSGWRRADRAWARGNRHVRIVTSGACRGRGVADLPPHWLKSYVESPEQLLAADSVVRFCKQSARCRVALASLPFSTGAVGVCVKSVILRKRLSRWLGRWRWSGVRRAWEIGHALLRRGIDTPRPLLMVEKQRGAGRRGYLVTEWIAATLTARDFTIERLPGLSGDQRDAWLRAHARRLAVQLRRMHESGFDHRDLKLSNLLVSRNPEDPRVWLLDLEGVRVWKRLPWQRGVQNLARLEVSAHEQGLYGKTLRLRFLRWYLGEEFQANWRIWWKAGELAGAAKRLQNEHRERPIS